jgi:hypothetical protein
MPTRSTVKLTGYLVGLAYFYGLILGGLSLVWQVLFQNGLPTMSRWQWLFAPLAIGGAAMGGEWLVQRLQDSTGFGEYGKSRSKRLLHLAILLVVFAAISIGPAMYKIANP